MPQRFRLEKRRIRLEHGGYPPAPPQLASVAAMVLAAGPRLVLGMGWARVQRLSEDGRAVGYVIQCSASGVSVNRFSCAAVAGHPQAVRTALASIDLALPPSEAMAEETLRVVRRCIEPVERFGAALVVVGQLPPQLALEGLRASYQIPRKPFALQPQGKKGGPFIAVPGREILELFSSVTGFGEPLLVVDGEPRSLDASDPRFEILGAVVDRELATVVYACNLNTVAALLAKRRAKYIRLELGGKSVGPEEE